MDAPLARHLARFSRQPPAGASVVPVPAPVIPVAVEPSITLTVAALEARLTAARDEVREDLSAAHAAERDRVERGHSEALQAAVMVAAAQRDAEEGAAFAAAIESAVAGVRTTLAEQIAGALRPLLSEAVAARALAQLMEAVERVLASPEPPALTISGPPARLAAIEAALATTVGITFEAGEGEEIRVSANGVHVETRLASALSALSLEIA